MKPLYNVTVEYVLSDSKSKTVLWQEGVDSERYESLLDASFKLGYFKLWDEEELLEFIIPLHSIVVIKPFRIN